QLQRRDRARRAVALLHQVRLFAAVPRRGRRRGEGGARGQARHLGPDQAALPRLPRAQGVVGRARRGHGGVRARDGRQGELDRAHKLRRHRSAGEARRQGGRRPGRDRVDQGRRPGPDAHHAVAQAGERLPADRVGPRRARGDWRGQAPGRIRARARVRVPLHQPAVEEVRAPDRHRSAEPGVDLVGGVEGPRGGGGRELRRWILLLCAAAACGKKGGSTPECAATFLAGDLVISEVMPNPTGDDTGKEWFEVYNADTRAVDLAGLELIVSLPDRTMEKAVAVTAGTIPAGGYFVFSSSAPDLVPGYADYGYGTGLGS